MTSAHDIPAEVQRTLHEARRVETDFDGGAVVWHIWGEGMQGRLPLVLLHGGGGSWLHWIRNVQPLAQAGWQVLVPDLPGFGDSDKPVHGGDADVLPEPLFAGLQQLMGLVPVHLVGFSFGGLTAGLMAAQAPERVVQLVLVGAPALGLVPKQVFTLTSWRHLDDPVRREAAHRQNLETLMLAEPAAVTPLALWIQATNVARDRMQRRRLSRTDLLARALDNVSCPVHAIYGAADVLYRGQFDALEAALRRVPAFADFQAIDGAGHWALFERPDAFNAALMSVLLTHRP